MIHTGIFDNSSPYPPSIQDMLEILYSTFLLAVWKFKSPDFLNWGPYVATAVIRVNT
jgi:hypothetical protein